ncbi:DNRLRE domain-containing protein [Streptomyces solicathayae]|uniref:DNRLRE domain-containing protein n=1 Tax=Streptomyces solicathayae TaxID=3081768 RepID=A0ABZ0M3V6_9ACTN|nr:DNRLRE domain-containing protein [Streptomyces sp. HUAS YS2]WOX26456.1 DNRLRE domain-containing protein [Streptomyces sp. HUAS YS2]
MVASAVTIALLPQSAYAATAPDADGGGLGDIVRGWFADDDKGPQQPQAGGEAVLPSREKLPKGVKAPKARRVAELNAKRTTHSRYWRMSDGRVQAEVSAVPTGYREGKSWKSIDTGVSATDRQGYAFANTTNTARSWFGSTPDRLLRFETTEGHHVTLGLQGAGALAPAAAGSRVTYRNAVAGADLVYEVGPGRVKENIVLRARPDRPVSFTFTLDPGGLTPKARKDGSIGLYGEGADPLLELPPAFMTDAKPLAQSPYGTAHSTAVAQKLTRAGKSWKVTVTPDATWLAAAERRYPVTIDPTIAIAPPPSQAQDVMISSDGPSDNYDTSWRLSVGNTTTGSSRALVKFPLGAVPAGTKLDSADLQLYYDQTHTTNADEVRLEAHRATASWNEATATWNSAQGITGELSGTSVLVDDGDTGTTAAKGAWPVSGNTAYTQYAVNKDYLYNKDSVAGDTYTWQPNLPEDGTYQVEAHYVPASDRATTAPYTVTYDGGSKAYTVNQQAGTAGVWKTLGAHPFKAGTLGKIVLGDGPASTTTSVIADAVRFTKGGVVTKQPGQSNTWHSFPVTKTVQQWIDGTQTNNGFVVKAADESANAPKGGPRYEGSEYAYNGEHATYPRLVLTFGRQGVDLAAPDTIHDTGAELDWTAYQDPSAFDTGDDLAEYQVHRSVYPTFTPSAATLVAPVAPGTTSFTDTSAVPTRADDPDPAGRAYYYMVAVKTKDGTVVPASTQLVRLPKAGRTVKLVEASQDTTLTSGQPTQPHDSVQDGGLANAWVMAGNNSATYGKSRIALQFPALGIPQSARVLEAQVKLWGFTTVTDTAGATYELRPLTRRFDESTATWERADATTTWTSPGGDTGAVAADLGSVTNDPASRQWSVTSLVQDWVKNPPADHGVLIKVANETGAGERTLFTATEASVPRLRPRIAVTYIDSTTASTYYAPTTPARMTPNSDHTVEFTLTNTTTATWRAGTHALSYRWTLPDGTDVTTGGNRLETALPADLLPGDSVTLQAKVRTPINSASGNKRTDYQLTWDVRDTAAGTWVSDTSGPAGLSQNVAVEEPTSNQLGLEKYYSYSGKNTGAGSSLMNNTAAGNAVWQYNAFNNPGRGLNTFVRLAYNTQDTSDTVAGHGWSVQAAGPIRLGAPLDFHPNPHPTEVRLPDGDGTTHVFRKQPDGSWKAPAGVHFKLSAKAGLDCTPDKDPVPDAWTLTRPDGTRFLFGCDGYQTSAVDKNGNTQTFTYEERKSNNKPVKFLTYITDPAGRQSLTVTYFTKADSSNPKIVDHIKSITDIAGRKLTLAYSDKGLLTTLTDGAGSTQPKVFGFEYDATQGNKNVKLVKITDPRGNATGLGYYYPSEGDDPKYHWWTQTITDRTGGPTRFAYRPDTADTAHTVTGITDAEGRLTTYTTDDFGRPVTSVNAKSQTTELAWDADNNVTYMEEANGARTAFCYDPLTGYPLWKRTAENNRNGVPPQSDCAPGRHPADAQRFEYVKRLDGYSSDLYRKISPEGRTWEFGYDTFGNLKTVTDPKGVATTEAGDYTTTYEYNSQGLLTRSTDANGHATLNSEFGPTGYPAKITNALGQTTAFVYDERGRVGQVTNPLQHRTTQTYDTYGRPLVRTVPKDQARDQLISTPAPVYDANDNVTRAIAPNGAVSTAVYDAADQITSASAPKDTPTAPERTTSYTYDRAGHVKTITDPQGTATPQIPDDYTTVYTYDEIYQLTAQTDALGHKTSYAYDSVGNNVTVVDPKKNATSDPDDFASKMEYDLEHRLTKVTDPLGVATTRGYDKDALLRTATNAAGSTTLFDYDERGKQTEVKVPHEGATDDVTYRTTRYEYDEVGNSTRVISPRGTETANPDDFATRVEYDALNRPVKNYLAFDPSDSRYNSPNVYTETVYDAAGRVERTSLPASKGQTVRNDTKYSYFDNGWLRSSTDPWDISTAYEYDDLGLQTSRTLTSAGGSVSRTMGWTYYPSGKLKDKTDDGVPVGTAVPLVDNSDVQHTGTTGTWTRASGTGQQGYDHHIHAAGAGTDRFTWKLNVPKAGTYTAYVKFPQVSGASRTARYKITHIGGSTDKTVDQSTGAGAWVQLGSYTFAQGDGASLELTQSTDGAVVADGVKLVRDISGETDTEKHHFQYSYDVNGNLSLIDDKSPGAEVDAYTLAYTELNQVSRVTESLAGQTRTSTDYTYDANGQPETVKHPDQYSKYTYDLREKVKSISVGESPTDPDPKVSGYTYDDLGQVTRETKDNGNTVGHTYFRDGLVKTSTEKKADGTTLVASHAYTYDANGNKARDVAKKMNADNHAAYLDSTTDYTYDPVDRIAKSVKTGNGAATETYVHDDNANVVDQTVGGVSTTFEYDRNRLQRSVTGGSASTFTYDPLGRKETVSAGGQIVSRSIYDGFDHVVESQQRDAGGAMKSTTYRYDPLDRTAAKTADGETTDYRYLGLSQEVLTEQIAGKLSKSYQYAPSGQRLSQVKHNEDGTEEDGYYGYNSHTDVETLTDERGDTRATYGYTAYGNDDKSEFTGIDKPDPADPTKEEYNSYRFNAKRWDSGSGTYDMGFRDYDPGLNRFTTRDMYNGALADMSLGSDPFTGNRYAFTGGNPISNVEIDGHFAFAIPFVAAAAAAVLIEAVVVAVVVVAVVAAVAYVATEVAERIEEASEDEATDETAEPEPKPAPRPRPGPDPDTDDDDNDEGCGGGWVDYKDTDSANGNRATGVEACLTKEYVESNSGSPVSVYPPGYRWAQDFAEDKGLNPQQNINACHLLGNALTGSGSDRRNLATCSRGANAKQRGAPQGDDHMRSYESQVYDAVMSGQDVMYTVTPIYDGARTVPTGFRLTAYGTHPDGTMGLSFDTIVPNTLRTGDNLGTQSDNGAPVPTGGTS